MPLGLQSTTIGALGGYTTFQTPAVAIEDYWWEEPRGLGPGYLTPIWDSIDPMIPGSHDTWNLHPATSAQGYYSPHFTGLVGAEGYWDVDDASGTHYLSIKPLDDGL